MTTTAPQPVSSLTAESPSQTSPTPTPGSHRGPGRKVFAGLAATLVVAGGIGAYFAVNTTSTSATTPVTTALPVTSGGVDVIERSAVRRTLTTNRPDVTEQAIPTTTTVTSGGVDVIERSAVRRTLTTNRPDVTEQAIPTSATVTAESAAAASASHWANVTTQSPADHPIRAVDRRHQGRACVQRCRVREPLEQRHDGHGGRLAAGHRRRPRRHRAPGLLGPVPRRPGPPGGPHQVSRRLARTARPPVPVLARRHSAGQARVRAGQLTASSCARMACMAADTVEIDVGPEGIRLGQLLKLASIVDSGGEAKALLESGEVRVNGRPETRRGAQLKPGDTVHAAGRRIRVYSLTGPRTGYRGRPAARRPLRCPDDLVGRRSAGSAPSSSSSR